MSKRQRDPLLHHLPGGYVNSKGRVFPSKEAAEPTARKHRGLTVKMKGKTSIRVPLKKSKRSE